MSRLALSVLLYYHAKSTRYYHDVEGVSHSSFMYGAAAMNDPRSHAQFLSHPGCVGEPREWMLQRFEELVFHNGQPVFLKPEREVDDSEPVAPGTDPALLAGDSTDLRLPLAQRRFHNLHDAAAWIEQNWPDSDLETNHPMTWRAGN